MSDRDPFMNLAGSIDDPVAPNAAFAAGLKSRLMESLAERDAAGPIDLGGIRKRPDFSTWLQIAAVLILAIGVTAASISLRHNDPTPTVIPAVQGQATGSSEAASEVSPIWRALPVGQPNMTANSSLGLGDSLAIDDNNVFRLVGTSNFQGLIAYDSSTGTLIWQQEFQHQGGGLATTGDGLIFVTSTPIIGATIAAFDQQTGKPIWSTASTVKAYNLVYEDERLFIWDGMAELVALDAGSGKEVASRRFTHASRSGPELYWENTKAPLIVVGKILVVGTMGGLVAAVPVSSFDAGPLLWRQEAGNAAMSLASSDGVIAVLTYRYDDSDGTIEVFSSVAAFDVATGELLWQTPDHSTDASSPFAISGGFAFNVASRPGGTPDNTPNGNAIQARDARTGEVLWAVEGHVAGMSTPNENTLIALNIDGEKARVVAISTADGSLSPRTVAAPDRSSPIALNIDDQRLYMTDDDSALVAYELRAFFDD